MIQLFSYRAFVVQRAHITLARILKSVIELLLCRVEETRRKSHNDGGEVGDNNEDDMIRIGTNRLTIERQHH